MGTPILRITNGTLSVNLLALAAGFHLQKWEPAVAEAKGGGIWRDNPLAGGRRLALRSLGNVIEKFAFSVNTSGPDEDGLIRNLQDLYRLLEAAVSYFTSDDWNTTPVWLEARAGCETNTRYALIHDYRAPGIGNPYAPPFVGILNTAVEQFDLILERGHWLEAAPGTATAIQVLTPNRAATTARECFVANKSNIAQLTHIYHYDDSTGVFSANLIAAAVPFALLPAVPAVDDCVYFIIDTAAPPTGPFGSLVFDIGTPQDGDLSLDWQHWTGAAWVNIPVVVDNTSTTEPFELTGVNSVVWMPGATWATVAINGITGWIVRAKVTAVIGGGSPPPTQQNRAIYTVLTPYVEVDNLQVPGDIAALACVRAFPEAYSVTLGIGRLIAALRTKSRGANFTPFINLAGGQNPTGITIIAGTGTPVARNDAPTGYYLEYDDETGPSIVLSTTLSEEYRGRFWAALRCKQINGAAGDYTAALSISTSTSYATTFKTAPVATASTSDWQLLEFGLVSIPAYKVAPGQACNVELTIDLEQAVATAAHIALIDLILMPVDEWSGAFYEQEIAPTRVPGAVYHENCLAIDSISDPREALLAYHLHLTPLTNLEAYTPFAAGPAIWQANSEQRLFFFWQGRTSSTDPTALEARGYAVNSVQAYRMARYLLMRGNR